ncbi:MAG: hypothetical protein QME42_04825 [bacterium]|nr:hypothetical protein [bacterium]
MSNCSVNGAVEIGRDEWRLGRDLLFSLPISPCKRSGVRYQQSGKEKS